MGTETIKNVKSADASYFQDGCVTAGTISLYFL